MRAEEGRLYVFPGWLEHGVEENQSDADRVSLSFNVLAMPKAESGGRTGANEFATAIAV
jgi:ectoine hydroxylase-related dioxygenase (phytanoyl-CoA dioxygenase family)